jgi:BirA family biotin operon repressor/biotin-[acetyl-CoA-carboxylase] ligase
MAALPPGWRRIAYASLDSTNTALKRLIADGDRDLHEGVIITAEAQTAGRGRQGRDWVSPAGNLYASFLIEAPEPMSASPQVGFVAAVALVDAFATPGVRLRCKWPNDVLAHGAKLSGILPELAGTWIVLGIGVNLQPVSVVSDYPVTSLAEQGLRFSPDRALAAVSGALASRLAQWRSEGFGTIAAAWSAVGPARGEPVTVRLPGPGSKVVSGRFTGLDGEGALMLDTDTGPRRILAGDVLFASPISQAGAV